MCVGLRIGVFFVRSILFTCRLFVIEWVIDNKRIEGVSVCAKRSGIRMRGRR